MLTAHGITIGGFDLGEALMWLVAAGVVVTLLGLALWEVWRGPK